MVDVKPLDPEFPIQQQLGVDTGPVVLVNLFTVDPADQDALIEAWRNDALYMKTQPVGQGRRADRRRCVET